MRSLLAAVLLFLPAVGFGQGIVLTVNGAGTSGVLAFNASGCGNLVAGNWVGTSLTTACTSLQIWTSATTCSGAAPSTTNVPPDFLEYTLPSGSLTTGGVTTDTFSFAFSTLPSFTVSGNSCGSVVDFTNYLCGGVTLNDTTGSCTGSAITSTPVIALRYDNVPPLPPAVNVTPLDSQLSVSLSPSDPTDTISSFNVYYAVDNTADGGTPNYLSVGSVPINNPRVTISGLVNGTNYLIKGNSVDEATNVSIASQPVPGSPVLTLGFYANYLNAGGQPGGCGDSAGGAPSALAFATLLLLVVARRRG